MTVVVAPLSESEKLCLREVFTSAWASGLLSGYICTYVFVKFSLSHGHREIKLVMENEFLDKVEDNAAVHIWSEQRQLEKGDSIVEGCFAFGKLDLVPTVEEYTTLLRCSRVQADKAYFRAADVPNFVKKLMSITGMSE
ncbi:6-phosphofructo-2-kinase/fructose-2,6-bisphosphatase-like protein [Gossypium australe]|uniref:6-phosphofructo-2-kinase/fructose-2, 6-bisphosphatase-like protein n=1 Tax=Gossypium australe TaxID=47621 RepID=A0A5B6V977_9ROSI|nr:6-phosphofructo-2-kinase/fructose-2,6-bisphosphatase-like protein [Gossypium australe]